jgi:hypothetical protein
MTPGSTTRTASSFLGFCDDAGHFQVDDRAAFRAYMAAHFSGQEVVVTVQPKTRARSLRANAYYWGVVVDAAVEATGQDADTIHAFWCEQFLPSEAKRLEFFNTMTKQRIKVTVDTRRTSSLTGQPFYDFVEECRLWLQEWLGVTTQDPDPAYWRKRGQTQEVTA